MDIAKKAHKRLYRRYWKLVHGRSIPHKALVAVARELLGFIWDMLYTHAEMVNQERAKKNVAD